MKRVKYLPEDVDRSVSGVTYGKVYFVLEYNKEKDSFLILNDRRIVYEYYLTSFYDKILFVDVTSEYRNKIIDDILL